MLARLINGFITLVKSVPVPVSILLFSLIAVLIALPISLTTKYLVAGHVTLADPIATIVTASIISVPVSYLICLVVRHLQKSEERLALARSDATDQVVELAAARQNAVAANQAKSAFLAQMSHELRTPLNAVIGFSEILAKQEELRHDISREVVIEYASIISQGGNTLLSLVNDLLDLSKIEAGELKLSSERFSVTEVMAEAVSYVSIQARDRGIALTVSEAVEDLEMRADKRALSQILINLLSNAIKFSPNDVPVEIGVKCTPRFLTFMVRDQGPGMTREEQEMAIQPFAQLSNAMVADEKGTGLGLPIVKSLIELEGGALVIESTPGGGTAVSIRYPAARVVRSRRSIALSA